MLQYGGRATYVDCMVGQIKLQKRNLMKVLFYEGMPYRNKLFKTYYNII